MKIMNCPLNGPRNIAEFVCGGEVREMPDPDRCSDAEWADHVFMQNNPAGVVTRMVAARADLLLVHRRAQHAHRRDSGDHDGARVHGAARGRAEMARPAPAPRLGQGFGLPGSTRAGRSPSPSRAAATEGFEGDAIASALAG